MAIHLVTGGSGFVGSNIARILYERGEQVRVLDIWRDDAMPSGIEFAHCDITDRDGVDRAMRGVDYVHHNVALVPLTKAGRRFDAVNVGGTRNALEAARRHKVKMFAHMSSSTIFGSPETMPITNDTPLEPIEPYGVTKRDADILVQAAGKDGLPVSLIRPRTVIGTGRLGIFEILFEWIRDNANIYIIGTGNHPFQFVHNDDLAEVSIQCCLQETPGAYNVGTDRFGTLREDLGALIAHAGTGSTIKSLPVGATITALTILDKLRLSPLGPWHYLSYHKPFHFDIEPIVAGLGWKPRYGNQEMMFSAYDWFVRNHKPTTIEHTSIHKRSVKQGVLRLLKAVG